MGVKVILSGGFDPLHIGHLRMIREAAQIGSVHVIVNSDDWLIRKKSYCTMNLGERMEMLRELKSVEGLWQVDDKDDTVVDGLESIVKTNNLQNQPDTLIFANGGDRLPENTPEVEFCRQNGIICVFGVGGPKTHSSSEINQRVEERPWGKFTILRETPDYWVKLLHVEPNQRTSIQSHAHRFESWLVTAGEGELHEYYDEPFALRPGTMVDINLSDKHRLAAGPSGITVIELAWSGTGQCEEDDITRYEDDYGR